MVTVLGCETSKKAERTDAQQPQEASTLDTDAIVDAAEAARDRNFEGELTFERVESIEELDRGADVPESVRADRALLLEQLFGRSAGDVGARLPYDDVAILDEESMTIRYVDSETEEQTRRAVFAAVVRAIDAQQFDPIADATSWDEYLARQTATSTTVAFAVADDEAAGHDHVTTALLAERPELATRIDALDSLVGSQNADGRSINALERRFVRLESWTLAAALHRANGWSGVELAWLMPPTRTSDVVQPGHWLTGEPVARWQWPDAPSKGVTEGRVGAAVTSFWLAHTVSASALRTLFAGWTSDSYRFIASTEERPARFEWLTLWDSPASASQVTKAFELTLRERFPEKPEQRFVVFQKGLKVGVILSDEPPEDRRERAREILGAKVQFAPRDGLPVSFVPTRSDVVAERTGAAKIDAQTWTDPLSGLRMNLEPLDGFDINQPRTSAVRWFAQGPDGALVQLTMEMDDPLGPAFGGEEYREGLRKAFTDTLSGADISGISNAELPFGRTLQATVEGSMDGQSTRIRFWHFKIDDLVFTYSYQAPVSSFAKHQEAAKRIIESTEVDASTTKQASEADASDGIIEFEVEEE
jgi:hypothetical protein